METNRLIRERILPKIQNANLIWKTLNEIIESRDDLSVAIIDMKSIIEDAPETVSGIIFYDESKFFIWISKDSHPNRQRFTLAHELGHYILHDDFLKNPTKEGIIIDDSSWLYRKTKIEDLSPEEQLREREANVFAAEILMPENKVKEYFEKDDSIAVLADTFSVSESAMTFRLINLWLLKDYE